MKKANWILGFLLFVFAATAVAQPGQDDEPDMKRKDKIESLKRAYISEKLEISVAEAEKFWPVYNDFDKKKDAVRKTMRQSEKKMKEGTHTEKEVLESIDLMAKKKKEEVDLDTQFLKDCMPILGATRVLKLSGLQKEFQKELVQRMKERRQQRGEGQQGPGQGMGKKRR